jgi:hypothetical protein
VPSLQAVRRCQRPAPSPPPLLPRQDEKAERRSLRSRPLLLVGAESDEAGQAVFQGLCGWGQGLQGATRTADTHRLGSTVVGQVVS